MSVGKEDIARKVADKTGLTLIDARLLLVSFLDAVKGELAMGRRIELRGFGRFFVKEKKAGVAKNPRNNQVVNVEHRFVPKFKISDEVRKKLNNRS